MGNMKHLQKKIDQWGKGQKPFLSSNEAVAIWFVTGDEPKELPGGSPNKRFLHLSNHEIEFLINYDKDEFMRFKVT